MKWKSCFSCCARHVRGRSCYWWKGLFISSLQINQFAFAEFRRNWLTLRWIHHQTAGECSCKWHQCFQLFIWSPVRVEWEESFISMWEPWMSVEKCPIIGKENSRKLAHWGWEDRKVRKLSHTSFSFSWRSSANPVFNLYVAAWFVDSS